MRQISPVTGHHDDNEDVAPLPSGLLVVHLPPGAQLVLWALRQRQADGGPASRDIVYGFRLAFGLTWLEPGLAVFENLFSLLSSRAARPFHVAPLRSGVVLEDERRILDLLAAAEAGDVLRATRVSRTLVAESAVSQLCAWAETMAGLLARRDWHVGEPESGSSPALH